MGNAEAIEIYWTVMITLGLWPGISNVVYRIREYTQLRRAKINDGAQFVAAGYVTADMVVLFVLVACLTVGILAMFLPHTDSPRTTIGTATAWILFFVGFLVVAVAWIIWFITKRYRDYAIAKLMIEKHEQGEKHDGISS